MPAKMDTKMDINVVASGRFPWSPLEHRGVENSIKINDLRCFLDFLRIPWNDAVERVKGIEPSYEAWEAAVLPLNYTRSIANYRQHLQALHPMPVWLRSGCRDACWAVVAAAEMRERFDTLQPHG